MASITVIRNIHAPVDVVFQTVADAKQFAQAISGVTKVEILSNPVSGVGSRFRQSRIMNGKESTMEFEVTEYVNNEHVRIVNETHGTIWDSFFTVASEGASTKLTMQMVTKSKRLVSSLLMPLICILIKKSVENDFDAVKSFCERNTK